MIGEEAVQGWREYVMQLDIALAEGRRGDAAALLHAPGGLW